MIINVWRRLSKYTHLFAKSGRYNTWVRIVSSLNVLGVTEFRAPRHAFVSFTKASARICAGALKSRLTRCVVRVFNLLSRLRGVSQTQGKHPEPHILCAAGVGRRRASSALILLVLRRLWSVTGVASPFLVGDFRLCWSFACGIHFSRCGHGVGVWRTKGLKSSILLEVWRPIETIGKGIGWYYLCLIYRALIAACRRLSDRAIGGLRNIHEELHNAL